MRYIVVVLRLCLTPCLGVFCAVSVVEETTYTTSLVNDHTDTQYQQKVRYSKAYVNGSLWYVVLWKMNLPISNCFDVDLIDKYSTFI